MVTPIPSGEDFLNELASEDMFGLVLDHDLSAMDVMADPLIKHYAAANHFLDYNMTLRRTRLALKTKFFFRGIFKRPRKPKREAKRKRRMAKREAKSKVRQEKKQTKLDRKVSKRHKKEAKRKKNKL